jgi:Trypsin
MPPRDGGFYTLLSQGPTSQMACVGDSGGPLFRSTGTGAQYGRTFGVASAIAGSCDTGQFTFFTSLDTAARPGNLSNKAWVDRAITETCTKKVSVVVPPEGKVEGSLMNASFTYSDDISINGEIDCPFNDPARDCVENVHYDESLAVVALPTSPSYIFKEWVTPILNPSPWDALCPCVGQGASCNILYDDIGYYDADVSTDNVVCEAVFEFTP